MVKARGTVVVDVRLRALRRLSYIFEALRYVPVTSNMADQLADIPSATIIQLASHMHLDHGRCNSIGSTLPNPRGSPILHQQPSTLAMEPNNVGDPMTDP